MVKKKKQLVRRMPLESLLKINAEALSFCKCPHLKSLSLRGVGPQRHCLVWDGGGGCVPGWSGVHSWILADMGFNYKSSDIKFCF